MRRNEEMDKEGETEISNSKKCDFPSKSYLTLVPQATFQEVIQGAFSTEKKETKLEQNPISKKMGFAELCKCFFQFKPLKSNDNTSCG